MKTQHQGKEPDVNNLPTSAEAREKTKNHLIEDSHMDRLPTLLRGICEFASKPEERDILFASTLGILSGIVSVTGVYAQRTFYPNLFVIVVAPPASGKGIMKYARKLLDIYGARVKQLPEHQRKPRLFLPANSSSAALHDALKATKGMGVIFEPEALTLTTALRQDWGAFIDVLLKGFQQEDITLLRKGTENQIIDLEIPNPRFSMVLSGTPTQLWPLIQSVESGLFSRLFFIDLQPDLEWRDVSPNSKARSLDDLIKPLQQMACDLLLFDSEHPFEMTLTAGQWDTLNNRFSHIMRSVVKNTPDLHSTVKRLGLGVFKMCMVLTALRKAEAKDESPRVACSDDDFQLALHLAERFLRMAMVYLPARSKDQTISKPIEGGRLLSAIRASLPANFTTKDLIDLAKKLEIDERTMYDDLKKLQPRYIEKRKNGHYRIVREV